MKEQSFHTDPQALNIPWVESPFFESILEEKDLDPELEEIVRKFSEDGYCIFDPELPDGIEDAIIENLKDLHTYNETTKSDTRVQDAWKTNEDVRTVAVLPKVLELLRALYQREPVPFQTLNFCKGTQQATHSDAIHFHSEPARFMCGVWVAYEDIHEANGPLHYYPGSHRLPVYSIHDFGIAPTIENPEEKGYDRYHYYKQYYEPFIQELAEAHGLKKIEVSLKKGQALIWAANLLHGGNPILDPNSSRHSQVTHYFFSDCMYYTPLLSDPFLGRPFLRNVTNIVTGEFADQAYNSNQVLNPGWAPTRVQGKDGQVYTPTGADPKRCPVKSAFSKIYRLSKQTLDALGGGPPEKDPQRSGSETR